MTRSRSLTVGCAALSLSLLAACAGGAAAPTAMPEPPTLTPTAIRSTPVAPGATATQSAPPANEEYMEYPAPAVGYAIGGVTVQDVWVDIVNGDDSRSGASRAEALRTLTEAWNRIAQGAELTVGYRLLLAPGLYPEAAIPTYFESRYGTAQFPIILQGADGPGTVTLGGFLNIYDTRYLYLLDLSVIPDPPGDVFHCEKCDHILIRNVVMNGGGAAHETIKANQSQYLFVEDSDLSGTYENAIDFVAVQYASILRNHLHDAEDWCAYVKGGSAYIRVEGNEFYNCGTGGFSAGQGTGFQYMVAPWIQYEAYDVKVVNNVFHDLDGACLGVNGGYNILMAHNTCYRVGARSHVAEFAFGFRSCDGQEGDPERARCTENLAAGGWGTTAVSTDDNAVRIPNKNVFFYNNLIYNPPGYQSQWQVFTIFGPFSAPTQNGAGVPTLTDENLQIRGNLIWDGGPNMLLGIEDPSQGCQPANPSCNADQLRAENAINIIEPQLTNPDGGDFHPVPGGNVFGVTPFSIPDFAWDDSLDFGPVPVGDLSNAVAVDYDENARTTVVPGALQ